MSYPEEFSLDPEQEFHPPREEFPAPAPEFGGSGEVPDRPRRRKNRLLWFALAAAVAVTVAVSAQAPALPPEPIPIEPVIQTPEPTLPTATPVETEPPTEPPGPSDAEILCTQGSWQLSGGDCIVHFDSDGNGWWHSGIYYGLMRWDETPAGRVHYVGTGAVSSLGGMTSGDEPEVYPVHQLITATVNGEVDVVPQGDSYVVSLDNPLSVDGRDYGPYGGPAINAAPVNSLYGGSALDLLDSSGWSHAADQPRGEYSLYDEIRFDHLSVSGSSGTLSLSILVQDELIRQITVPVAVVPDGTHSNTAQLILQEDIDLSYDAYGVEYHHTVGAGYPFQCVILLTDDGPQAALPVLGDVITYGTNYTLMLPA